MARAEPHLAKWTCPERWGRYAGPTDRELEGKTQELASHDNFQRSDQLRPPRTSATVHPAFVWPDTGSCAAPRRDLRLCGCLLTSVGSCLRRAAGAVRGVRDPLRVRRKLLAPGGANAGERLAGVAVGDHHVEEVDGILEVRVAAGYPGPRSRTALLELADMPVLAVGQVPESNGIRGVEIRQRNRRFGEQELADDVRPRRPVGDEAVDEQVVRVDRQEGRRPDDAVVDATLILGGDAGHRRPAPP